MVTVEFISNAALIILLIILAYYVTKQSHKPKLKQKRTKEISIKESKELLINNIISELAETDYSLMGKLHNGKRLTLDYMQISLNDDNVSLDKFNQIIQKTLNK